MLFTYRMELANGEAAHPPKRETAVSSWRPADSIVVSPKRRYQVVAVRSDLLVVEPVPAR